jgi:hypothetical protein
VIQQKRKPVADCLDNGKCARRVKTPTEDGNSYDNIINELINRVGEDGQRLQISAINRFQ